MSARRVITAQTARRLFVSRQGLAGRRPVADADSVMGVFRELGCVQIDPIRAVERTQLLVLHSRLTDFEPATLDQLLFEERRLFEYWAHAASIVRMEDYPLFQVHMRRRQERRTGNKRVKAWLAENQELSRHILDELAANGPLSAADFEDRSSRSWESAGWTSGQSVRLMLDDLWLTGRIMVADRKGNRKLWDLSERCLPTGALVDSLALSEAVARAASKSLRALGVATDRHIRQHFIRNGYPGLKGILKEFLDTGTIVPVAVVDGDRQWPGDWYVHGQDLPQLDKLEAGEWQPRTVLLSPFDNLICDRQRTETMFDFHYRIEIYVPKAKRVYGYYVMPILYGDRLIGRLDAKMDRKAQRLDVIAIYAEEGAPKTKAAARAIRAAIEELARFLAADEIAYGSRTPAFWRSALS